MKKKEVTFFRKLLRVIAGVTVATLVALLVFFIIFFLGPMFFGVDPESPVAWITIPLSFLCGPIAAFITFDFYKAKPMTNKFLKIDLFFPPFLFCFTVLSFSWWC